MNMRCMAIAMLCTALAACGAEVAGSAATAAALQASQAQQAQAQQRQLQLKLDAALAAGVARAASAPEQ